MVVIGNASACNPSSGCCSNGQPQVVPQLPTAMSQEEEEEDFFPEDLSCYICKELFQAAVTIQNCNHSFCSFCVRRSFAEQSKKLKPKVTCPLCRQVLFERSFNRADKVLRIDLELQQKVFDCKRLHKAPSKQQQQQQQPQQQDDISPRRRSTRRTISPPKNHHQQQESTVTTTPYKPNPPLQKLNTVHYHGKKRNALVTMLRDYGLPTAGNEDELKDRHMRFILYWNSQCDERVDPPCRETVVQQFRSAELNKANAKIHDRIRKRTTTTASNVESSTTTEDEAQARAAVLKEHASGFRALYMDVLDRLMVTKKSWKESNNLSLAIAVLKSHPMIQNNNVNFRQCLRERAMNGNYQIPVKDLLSGDVPLPTIHEIPNLLPLAPVSGAANTGDATSKPVAPRTQNIRPLSSSQSNLQQQPPSGSQEERIGRPEHHVAKRQKFTFDTTSPLPWAHHPTTPAVTNPYSKKHKNNSSSNLVPPPDNRYSALKQPAAASTHGRSAVPTASVANNNPYSRGGSATHVQSTSNNTPLQPSMTSSASTRPQQQQQPQQNHYSRSIQPSNTMSANNNSNQPNATRQVSSYKLPPARNNATTTPGGTPQRHAVSPPTVAAATSAKSFLFHTNKKNKKKKTRTKPSWHWTCQICKYEMKMDPKAIKCAYCGGKKGATLEDPLGEGSSNDPIQMF